MIVLFTDFGTDDFYVGQLKSALHQCLTSSVTIVDLLHSAPRFQVRTSAHLLDALQRRFPKETVFLTVIDPGVGSERGAVVLQASEKWFVGPDNGLLSVVRARAVRARVWRIVWRPRELSASFHARDLFAPIAAAIASGALPLDRLQPIRDLEITAAAADLLAVIHIDHYGNAVTGLRAANLPRAATLALGGRSLRYARVFSDVSPGALFWYENSVGLVEIAANRASAARKLRLKVGDPVKIKLPQHGTSTGHRKLTAPRDGRLRQRKRVRSAIEPE